MKILWSLLYAAVIAADDDYWAKVGHGLGMILKPDSMTGPKQIDNAPSLKIDAPNTAEAGLVQMDEQENPFCPPKPVDPVPVIETVKMTWRFLSNTALILSLRDAFCAGQKYRVLDNGLYLAYNFPDLPTICGVSTNSRDVIYSPEFMETDYLLEVGYHNLTITILGSRLGNKVTSMEIKLLPYGPIDPKYDQIIEFKEMCRMVKKVPATTTLDDLA
jgi:hypothetical protein